MDCLLTDFCDRRLNGGQADGGVPEGPRFVWPNQEVPAVRIFREAPVFWKRAVPLRFPESPQPRLGWRKPLPNGRCFLTDGRDTFQSGFMEIAAQSRTPSRISSARSEASAFNKAICTCKSSSSALILVRDSRVSQIQGSPDGLYGVDDEQYGNNGQEYKLDSRV